MPLGASSAQELDPERVLCRESPEIHRQNQQRIRVLVHICHSSRVEPTNNRAERALRPQVVLRKILGTLRNEKGTSIHERIMTTLATWGQKGLDSLQMLTAKLAS